VSSDIGRNEERLPANTSCGTLLTPMTHFRIVTFSRRLRYLCPHNILYISKEKSSFNTIETQLIEAVVR